MDTNKFPKIVKKILEHRRQSRIDFMLSKVILKDNMKVIDIGCGVDGRSFDDYAPKNWHITGVDIHSKEKVQHNHPNFTYLQQDARNLSQFKNEEFDLAVCIGMMEHITDEATFKSIISELMRVSKQYIVAVPYKYCWLEPHYGVPFFPLFPYSLKVAMVKALNLSDHREAVTKDPEYINKHYRWLSNAEYSERLPGSKIYLLPTLEMIAITKSVPLTI
jgi:Methyltransferase domain